MSTDDEDLEGPPPFDDDDEPESHVPSTSELQGEAPRCTDSANADAFVLEHGRGYIYVVEWEAWIAWDGKRWDRTGARHRVVNAAMLTARLEHFRCQERLAALRVREREAAMLSRKDEDLEAEIKREAKLLKWHEQSQNAGRLDAVTRLLETRLTTSMRDLDRDPWLFNCANGTVDLRTAEMHLHRAGDLLTQTSEVEWDEHAKCPTWDAFVRSSMGGDIILALYLQRLIGYAITGLTTEHILAFFHGEGNNGKSTFLQVLRTVLGEYACPAPRDLLFEDAKGGQRHPSELARLYGKRMVVCAEVGENVTLDEAKVKDLTGGDAISVRRMREDFWDLEPTHTLMVAGNHKPTVRGSDLGIWRRIRLVPWAVIVDSKDVDRDLPAKLRAEARGILRWCVQGCLEWQRIGLETPESVMLSTAAYREESDALGDFLAGHCVFEADARISRQALRERYEAWCVESGHKPFGPKKVGARLRALRASPLSVREGARVKDGWAGVRLKSDFERQVEAEPGSSEERS